MANADTPHLHVEFYMDAVENAARTRDEGRPIFEDREMVRIRIVNDPKSSIVAPANSASIADKETGLPLTYAQRFPEHYRYFKDNLDQSAANGTPLSEVPWLTTSRRAELKALNVTTVEGLAGLDGTGLQRLGMDARALKSKAEAWLDKARGSATEGRLIEELAARDSEIASLKEQMNQIMSRLNATDAPAATGSPFDGYSADDLKAFIADRTGARPKGNPSRDTLVRMAEEIIASNEAEAA